MRRIIAVLALLLPSLPALGWNAFGHEAVAYIAWQNLTPDQRQTYSTILRAHPHYADDLEAGLPAGDKDHDLHVFMKAATWPDMIRSAKNDEKADHHSNWHYIDEPITPDHAQVEEPKIELTTAVPQNAVQAFRFEMNILRDKKAPPAARAKALCWVLHIAGDLHQPLHCVALYDADFPKGDRGGNSIQLANNDQGWNLHGLWDGMFGQRGDMTEVAKAADEATKQYAASVVDRAKELDVLKWAMEGRALAAKEVYRGIEIDEKGELLQNVDRLSVSPDQQYLHQAHETAKEQVVLGGERLAGALK